VLNVLLLVLLIIGVDLVDLPVISLLQGPLKHPVQIFQFLSQFLVYVPEFDDLVVLLVFLLLLGVHSNKI
jgi:hypothetical protein